MGSNCPATFKGTRIAAIRGYMAREKKDGAAVIGEFFIDEIFSEFDAMPKLGEECFVNHSGKSLFNVNCLPRPATFFQDAAWAFAPHSRPSYRPARARGGVARFFSRA